MASGTAAVVAIAVGNVAGGEAPALARPVDRASLV